MHISPGPENLNELFDGDVEVVVPSFQRNFVWKRENVTQFLDDLFLAAETGQPHFFGPIVIYDATTPGKSPRRLEVVDGQQRITTAVLVLCLLRDLLEDQRYFPDQGFGGLGLKPGFENQIFRGLLRDEPKFKASYLIRDFFNEAIILPPSSKTQRVTPNGANLSPSERAATASLRKDHIFIEKYLRLKFEPLQELALRELFHRLLSSLTENFQLHSMMVQEESDAYRLFESVNYLGIKLEPSDLLKSLTLRKIREHSPNHLDSALAQWDLFVGNLHGYPVSKFLRHYLLTQQKQPVQGTKVFSIFRNRIEASPNSAKANLERLVVASKSYSVILGKARHPSNSETLSAVARRLNIIGDTHRLLLLAILESGLSTSQKEQAFRTTEYLVFRVVCARENAQQVEDFYQKAAHELESITSQQGLDAWCDQLLSSTLSDTELTTHAVKNCSRSGIQYDPREDLAKYALAVIEDEIGGGWGATPTLEHLAPQNPNSATNWRIVVGSEDDGYDSQIRWWGNLTPLERSLNSSISNGDWDSKLSGNPNRSYDGLAKSGFFLTKQVCKAKVWDSNSIIERGDWLIETLLKLRSKAWANSGVNNAASISLWPQNIEAK